MTTEVAGLIPKMDPLYVGKLSTPGLDGIVAIV
jgi:hypothetical protein